MSDLINTQLGQYHLIEAIGHGGMATVYKAYQESLDRHVAVKVLLSNRDPQFAVRFKREARAIAALQHHNILPIYDYGEQNGLLYFVLQYVENGLTLHDLLGAPMVPAQALRLIGHVLAALEYAHARGVIHRDLKPANILLPSPNWALLADFGIAKLMNDSQHLTMTGFIIGTAAYMAPEQAAGRPIDARTDLYSLGVVLYEMLTGRVPFDSDTPMAVLTKHVYEAPPPPRSVNPNLAPALEAVLLRALAKYGRALAHTAAIAEALTAQLGGQPYDIEMSVDETDTPTSIQEHYFIARQLQALAVPVVSLAPRFVGKFQKGVDYIGDVNEFAAEFARHAAIMRHFGSYKLSIHTGSDKFSLYPAIAEHTGGRVHIKTAGTSYLEALRIAAERQPALFRAMLDYAREHFAHDRKTYFLDAQLEKVPAGADVADADLPALLDQFDTRQVLHVCFGSILDAFGDDLRAMIADDPEAYRAGLERHFTRHLQPFV
ncbi:hypothetical protein SE17_23200 [Kouleothrix aurantiaca]|uniref:non-specific serine/threonine protein kinase n=1 Tax=Kouleothrix aurantiaca TaxID=186479 RepID=A0A0P9DM34_9CHLR|nr:hypothetical protein SE17_23200 [Kouleothrix aurantiaca]